MEIRNEYKRRWTSYRKLVGLTEETVSFAEDAIEVLGNSDLARARNFEGRLEHFVGLGRRVIDQTRRRALEKERVPAKDKVVSIFEPHTDIIIKDHREVLYGHKLCLTIGVSTLVLDCVVEDGNPADATLVDRTLDHMIELYGRPPRQAAFDGGFASRANLESAKAKGVQDVCFAKGRGLSVTEMVKSSWVYRKLRRFRAGIEGIISFLKRGFGLDRATWKGRRGFSAYVAASLLSYNLLVIARHQPM
jgi:IS5 family transposase